MIEYMLGITWNDLALYLFTVKKLDRSNTNSYKSQFAQITEYFLHVPFDKIHLLAFFDYLENVRKIKAPTRNNYLKLLKHICKFLNVDYLNDFSYYPEVEPYIEVLTEKEINKLIECSYTIDYRVGVMTETLYRTAMRNNEVCELKYSDVMNEFLLLRNTKSGKMQQCYIQPDLYEKIMKIKRYPHEFVFGGHRGQLNRETLNLYLRQSAQKAGIKRRIHAHLLRHTAGYYAAKNNENSFKVQKFLRHADISSTVRYTHMQLEDIKEVTESLPLSNNLMTFETVRSRAKKFFESLKNAPCQKVLKEENGKIYIEFCQIESAIDMLKEKE